MKFLYTLIVAGLSLTLSAQSPDSAKILTNKKGVAIIPQKGNLAIGISASPFLEYAGNLFTAEYNPSPYFTSTNPGSIFIKYQNSTSSSIRANITLGITNSSDKSGNAFSPDEYDKSINSALTVGVSLGLEKYKSIAGRLRGYYGADLGLLKTAYQGYRYQSTEEVYGKYKFVDAVESDNNYEEVGGNTYSLIGEGFIGIEYFFLPKICVSGEFGFGLRGSMITDRKYVPENIEEVIFNPGGTELELYANTSSIISIFIYF